MSYEFLQQIDEAVLLWFNVSDSLYLDNVVMAFTSGLTWIPLYVALLYLVIKNSENMPQFALIVLGVLVTMLLSDGIVANVQSSAACVGDNIGVIAGTEGNLIIDNVNNPQTITVNGPDRTYIETIRVPQQITGYEYQFLACRQALKEGLLEPREMPHDEVLYIMQLMDELRKKWGVHYPMDEMK